ncbi:MAG: GNAT family N-acetyltransferase [Chloroflexi bacterium]|nr:GNAT family N-acetyltransferase [Chloroflexota bacterium]
MKSTLDLDKLFAPFPILETERLILRDLRRSDSPAMFEVFGDAQAMIYYGADVPHKAETQTQQLIEDLLGYHERRQGVRWIITLKAEGDRSIGSLGFYRFDDAARRCELGYELNRRYWRKGIMTEACSRIIDYGFTEVGLNRVEAATDDDNPGSQALLRKLGFQFEGCFRQRIFYKDKYWDENWFGLLHADYLAAHL